MSIRSLPCVIAALVFLGSSVFGQTASQLPAFEVISIKLRTGAPAPPQAQAPPDRFVRSNTTVVQLIQYAYGMQEFQVLGGPDWVRSDRFEVSAKADSVTTADRMGQMVKRMLAERFGLQTHTETREQNIYALVPARGDRRLGERMRPSAIDCAPMIDAGKVVPPKPGGPPAQCFWFVAMMNGANRMRVDGIRMPRFATFLEQHRNTWLHLDGGARHHICIENVAPSFMASIFRLANLVLPRLGTSPSTSLSRHRGSTTHG